MNIYEQDSYKKIIRYLGKDGPKPIKGFYRKLSEHLNTHPTYVSQVLSGDKDFSEEQMIATCDFLGMNDKELDYLLLVFKYERAGSPRLRDIYQQKVSQVRKETILKGRRENEKELSEAQLVKFYSSWIYSAVHMLTTLEKKPDVSAVEKRFGLNRQQAQGILSFLVQCGLAIEKSGRYHEGTSKTVLLKNSPYLMQLHSNWRLKALEKFSRKSEHELMFTSNFSLSHSDFKRLREETILFLQKFMETVDKSHADDVAYLNLDLLWV